MYWDLVEQAHIGRGGLDERRASLADSTELRQTLFSKPASPGPLSTTRVGIPTHHATSTWSLSRRPPPASHFARGGGNAQRVVSSKGSIWIGDSTLCRIALPVWSARHGQLAR